jgi:hypothetical protein
MEPEKREKPPELIRVLFIVLGTGFLAIGAIGIALPGLPTTPFLLLAAATYARSSPRLHRWLLDHPTLGPHIRRFQQHRSVALNVKIWTLMLAWAVLGAMALFVVDQLWLRLLLLGLALAKSAFMVRIKTAKPDRRS